MKYKMKALLAALLAVLLVGCSQAEENTAVESAGTTETTETTVTGTEVAEPEVRGPFQQFTCQDLDGNEVTEEIFADYDLTVVNIWGTFCGPCISEMPYFGELAEEYADKKVQIIGIVGDAFDAEGNVDSDVIADAKEIIAQTGADYLHIVPTNELYYSLMTQISAFPTTAFVDSTGAQVDYAYMGATDKETWAERIDYALSLVQE